MRQRKVKNIEEKLNGYEGIILQNPENNKGNWGRLFANEHPTYLEIGCGKGRFISSLSLFYPKVNFIGIEGNQTVALRALEKIKALDINNVKIIPEFIRNPEDWFDGGELEGIYLNFSDPWPKERHLKRRLTSKSYLNGYKHILKPGGTLEVKTDNDSFFDFTLQVINSNKIEILEISRDLHKSEFAAKGWITEYEEKFSAKGLRINYLKVRL